MQYLSEAIACVRQKYAELVPDLIFEVKSKSDSVTKLREKIQEFITYGTQVGVLVNPRTRTMEVYRSSAPTKYEKVVLGDGDVLQVPELLPGWELLDGYFSGACLMLCSGIPLVSRRARLKSRL